MVASSSVSNSNPTLDWADDTDDEIDFGAPVFSDDEDLPPALTRGLGSTSPLPAQSSQDDDATNQLNLHESSIASTRFSDRNNHQTSSNRISGNKARSNDHLFPYQDAPIHNSDRHRNNSWGPRAFSDRDGHRRSDNRRDNNSSSMLSPNNASPRHHQASQWARQHDDKGAGPEHRSTRHVIPLPPKPPAALDANNRSQSPSYRSRSPLPGTENRYNNSGQRTSSPYSDTHRSFSPNQNHIPPSGLSTRSRSPNHHSRAHMDQLSQSRDYSKRRPKETASDGRWEKIAHEDKPYPTHIPQPAPSPPKDDVIYFKRRDDRPIESDTKDRVNGTMYHERIEHNENSNDRWEKNSSVEHDKPLPDRSHNLNNNPSSHRGHARTKSRGQTEIPLGNPSLSHEKTNIRGARGKGKDQHKRQSEDPPDSKTEDEGSAVPWWEQSTYGGKTKKEESNSESNPPSVKENQKESSKSQFGSNEAKSTTPSETSEVPWWEQSTYKIKPKAGSVDQVSSGLNDISLDRSKPAPKQKGDNREVQTENETLSKQRSFGKIIPMTGVESLTLVSRDGDATGSDHSIKSRIVQEQVFAEIKQMTSKYETLYGSNKLEPIPPRTLQADAIDKILESFRKLREGLFATEAKDMFAAQVYQQSVLWSLYARNIPELTKALYHLVQEIHPDVYKQYTNTIPIERQHYIGLYILYQFAKPSSLLVGSNKGFSYPHSLSIAKPKTETDKLIVSLLDVYERHQRRGSFNSQNSGTNMEEGSTLGPELILILAYWKTLRDGNWIKRERLLSETLLHEADSWDLQLMIQLSMGDPLKIARVATVATISKAYYSLSVHAAAKTVGLVEPRDDHKPSNIDSNNQLRKSLQSSFGLASTIIMRDGQLLFKAKS